MPSNQTGLLIIRAWIEPGSAKPLRARVRLTTNVSGGFAGEMTFAEVGAVSAAVENWLDDFLLVSQQP